LSTRSGRRAAKTAAIVPPSENPNSDARSTPAASSTARMSSIRSFNDIAPMTGSDIPAPRLSKRMHLVNRASASWMRRGSPFSISSSRCDTQPGM
jgi:hypothetical protein